MASSTTSPMASTSPKSESVLTEKPSSGNTAKAPTSDTGTVRSGMSVARQLWRKTKTTSTTSAMASSSVSTISRMPAFTGAVVSSEISYFMPGGNRVARSAIVFRMLSATSSAFEPGVWKAAMTAAGCPLNVPYCW